MAQNTFTAAIAVVKIGSNIIGRMTNLNIVEDITVQPVEEIGNLFDVEMVTTKYRGSFTCSFFEANFTDSGVKSNDILRVASSKEAFGDTLTLTQTGVDLDIYKKESDIIDPLTNEVQTENAPYLQIVGAKPTNNTWDITAGRIVTRNQSFMFIEPLRKAPGQ